MSLAELANRTAPALVGQGVLIADIERVQGIAEVRFWELDSFKGRRLPYAAVTSWPRTVCMASQWYGQPETQRFDAEWQKGGYRRFVHRVWKRLDQAQIVVGHNFDRFDRRKLNSAFADVGLPPPSPYKVVDTLKVAWSEFGFESNTLDALCIRLGLTAKSDHYDPGVADAAVAGDREAQARIEGYNRGDIVSTEGLYDYFRPWIKNHPHNATAANDKPVCNRCWETEFRRQGVVLAAVISYNAYRCSSCGANIKTTMHHRAAATRGV